MVLTLFRFGTLWLVVCQLLAQIIQQYPQLEFDVWLIPSLLFRGQFDPVAFDSPEALTQARSEGKCREWSPVRLGDCS